MPTTKRLLDRRLSGALVVTLLAGIGGFIVSCSTERELFPDGVPDLDASASLDASPDVTVDATKSPRDAAKGADASARPVVCEAAPCATKLVTTLGFGTSGGFCALLADGTVACWGQNNYGQLGRGEEAGTSDSPSPARVAGLSDVVYLDHTCAIDRDGSTWCWGTGPYLRGPGAQTRELTPFKLPIPPAKMISFRATWDLATACAVVDEEVLCWGMNKNGQIAPHLLGENGNTVLPPHELPLLPGAPITGIVVGNASFVLRADGTAWSWGANPPLGRVSSLFPDSYPRPIALAEVSSLDATNEAACAVSEGTAYCWGAPFYPQTEPPLNRALPQPIPTPEPVVQITTSGFGNTITPQRGCACGASGAVYCWGNNASGQAGDGTKEYAMNPVKVAGLPAPASEVRATGRSTCALLTSGKIYCWGDNTNGQLGTGQARVSSVVPREVVLP